jgi:hypothetical protein
MNGMWILVLDDGETYSGVDGASLCIISEEQHELLCEGHSVSDITPLFELGLRDFTMKGDAA